MAALRLVGFALVFAILSFGGKWVGAQVHHVVGGDRGWDSSTDVASWSSGKTFRVRDKLWFTYSAAQGGIAEVKSREEYEACDVSNPIRMYTNGLDSISLETEGLRYFASSDIDKCQNGLRMHVEVLPEAEAQQKQAETKTPKVEESMVMADGPATPSGAPHLTGTATSFLVLCHIWVAFFSYALARE